MFETVDNCLSVLHFMHEESFEADTLDLVHRILFTVSRPNKLSHNCLSQDLYTCRLLVSLFCHMPETPGQKKLRLTKERLTNELRLRTVKRQDQLREEAIDRLTDEEVKERKCLEKAPCLYACLFCFWLLVVNLLFAQWFYYQGRLKLN